MAELGSHQLDASSIFISALSREKGKKVHPLNVHAVGGRHLFPVDRDADDHVYCMFEFPGQGYDYSFDVGFRDTVNSYPGKQNGIPSYKQDSDKKIVVSYSSINGNGFGGYGEVVMGTKATMVLDREKEVMLYPLAGTSAKAGVKKKGSGVVLSILQPVATQHQQKPQKAMAQSVVDTASKSSIGHGASTKATLATSLAAMAKSDWRTQ